MKSWIHELSESYVRGRVSVRRDLKENYVSLTEEQRFVLLSENVLNYIDEQLQNAYGFGWNDLSEERKKSLAQILTLGLLGRRQVPTSTQFGGRSPEDRMHDNVDVDDNPDPDNPSAYRWTEDDPAPKSVNSRGFFGGLKQKLIGASKAEEEKLQRAKTRRETGPESTPYVPSTMPKTRTSKREIRQMQTWQTPTYWDGGDMRGGHDRTGEVVVGHEDVEEYQDPRTGAWRDVKRYGKPTGEPEQLPRKIGSGHGMRWNDK